MEMLTRLRKRLIECGMVYDLAPNALEKLQKGAVLVIDRRPIDKYDGCVGWLKQHPTNGKQLWTPEP